MYSAPGSGYGPLFNDRFWPGGYDIRDMYRYITYKADVIADTPQKKQIRMTGVGKSGIYANVKIEKTFTLEKNSSLLKADFAITNGMDNVVPLQKGYWTYGGVQVPEGYNRVVPGLNGVEVSPAFKQLATRDISAGWYGVEAGGRGLAIIVPWERLKRRWLLHCISRICQRVGFGRLESADSFRIMIGALDKATGNIPYSLSGTSETNPWNAWDWYQLMPHLRTLASYSGEQTIQHRSFAPHRLASMPWIGYDGGKHGQHQKVLFNLMNGSTGFNIYGNFNIQTDYQISPRGKELIEVLNIYRNGPGEAIMRMGIKSHPIAFLYSPASIKVNWITGFSNQRTASTAGFSQMVKDASLVYDYIAYGQLEQGGVPSKYKIVFLPMCSAISDKEAAALEAFVKRGGILIADFRAGTFDSHGKKRTSPVLNKLFGIKSAGEFVKGSSVVTGTGALKGVRIKADYVETGITPVTARVLGTANGKPVIFENSYGKGKAVYFGCSAIVTFGDWKEMRYAKNNAPSTGAINNYIGSFFKKQGIAPVATAPTLRGTTIFVKEAGAARILATLRDINQTALLGRETGKHQIDLDKKYYIYDLLKGSFIGYGDKFSYSYTYAPQGVFVLLPYKAKGLDIKLRPDGAELELLADTRQFADHTFHVELLDGKGNIVPAFNDVLPGRGNKAFYKFRKPLNAAGKWKLQVREILTCMTRTVPLP